MSNFAINFVNGGWVAAMLAIIIFAIVFTLLQPFFTEKNRKQRVKIIAREVDDLRKYERARLDKETRIRDTAVRRHLSARGTDKISDRVKKLSDISTKFNLDNKVSDELRTKLTQAGYRREEYAYVYVLMKIIGIPAGLIIGLYLNFALGHEFGTRNYLFTIIGATLFGFFLPNIMVKNAITKRSEEIILNFPDSLDLMMICVQSGMTLELAIRRVSDEVSRSAPILGEELAILAAELNYIKERRVAYANFAERCGVDQIRDFTTAVVQSEIYGTSILSSLRVQADELRNDRMQRAENKANSLPAKLTLPLALFMLPVVFFVVLSPGVTNALRAF